MGNRLLEKLAKHSRIRVSLPFFSYEIQAEDLISDANLDTRIARLGEVKRDLQESIVAIEELQAEATTRKAELDTLSTAVKQLQEDRVTAETLLNVPQESFSRVLIRAVSKGRLRGIAEGSIVGFLSGVASSLLVWYLTK
jgi:hypothetical protein